jgi:pyridoxine 4-dehydrogenase
VFPDYREIFMPPFRQARADSSPRADLMSTFALGQMQVRRSGYGAMQLAGSYAFGTPPDRATAIGVLQAAVAAGVDHIDTAQYYGPGAVNDLIREALYPYPGGLAIVSKVAVRSDDSGAARPSDDPHRLRAGIEDNLRSLRVGQLAAVNLRLPGDGRVDARFDDQLAAMVAARDEGLIAGVGLSNVSPEQLKEAAACAFPSGKPVAGVLDGTAPVIGDIAVVESHLLGGLDPNPSTWPGAAITRIR